MMTFIVLFSALFLILIIYVVVTLIMRTIAAFRRKKYNKALINIAILILFIGFLYKMNTLMLNLTNEVFDWNL